MKHQLVLCMVLMEEIRLDKNPLKHGIYTIYWYILNINLLQDFFVHQQCAMFVLTFLKHWPSRSGGEGHHTQCSTALSGLVQVATGGPLGTRASGTGVAERI